jgi:hypothetical protein
MNERFDEIVRQTRLHNQSVYDNGEGGWIVQTAELKKFAELLIKECANIDFRKKAFLSQDDDASVAKTILEHFGVE